MYSQAFALTLGLTSLVSAAPALRQRQVDECQAAYKSCIAAGTPEVACSCTLTACVGEDSARNREYCASATASLTQSTATATSTFACNPAHSYPAGATCTDVNGALTLVTPAPSATSTTYACNPAHSYPEGVTCTSTNGALTLVTPAPTSTTASATYACNPAHSYPGGAACVSTNGGLSLVTPSPAPVTSSAAPAVATASGSTVGAAGKPAGSPTKVDDKTWSIKHLSRYCGDENTGCDYNFGIEADGKSENCTIIRMPGSNAATESWSNQPCSDKSAFKVSWGYVENPAPAFAVITLVDDKELAWFGVSDVNGQKVTASNPFGSGEFGDLNNEQVYTY